MKSGTPATAHDGQPVAYGYDVTNAGDAPLSNVTVTDDKCAPATYVSGDTDTNGKLDLGETWKFTCDYSVKHGDENAGHDVVNTATAAGTDTLGKTVSDEDSWTTHIVHPDLAIDKTERVAGDGGYLQGPITAYVGDTIEYEIAVTNPGDTAMDVTSLADPKCDTAPGAPSGDANTPEPPI